MGYGFLYGVERLLLGVLGAYFILSDDTWTVPNPVSFLLPHLVSTMQAVCLAFGPAAADTVHAPEGSRDSQVCAGATSAHPTMCSCSHSPALPFVLATALNTCPSGAIGSFTHRTSYDAGSCDSVLPCVPSDVPAATCAATHTILIVFALPILCIALVSVAVQRRGRRCPAGRHIISVSINPDGYYLLMPFGAAQTIAYAATIRRIIRLCRACCCPPRLVSLGVIVDRSMSSPADDATSDATATPVPLTCSRPTHPAPFCRRALAQRRVIVEFRVSL